MRVPTQHPRLRVALLLGVLTVMPCEVFAQAGHDEHPIHSAPVRTLTLAQALAQGALRSPEVMRAAAPRQALREASRVANPVVSQLPHLQAQVGPRISERRVTADVALSVLQPISVSAIGKHEARLARAAERAFSHDVQSAKLMSAEQAGQTWVALALADSMLKLRQDAVAGAQGLLELARKRVAAGEADPSEVALAESDVASARSLVIEAEGLHFAAELELRTLTGTAPNERVEAAEALHAEPALAAPQAGRSVSLHPDVIAAESRSVVSHEELEYSVSQQIPGITLGVQYQREGTGDQIVSALAIVPLPVARPWAFQEARQRAEEDAARATVVWVRTQTRVELELAEHEFDHARGAYQQLLSGALPPLREAERLALARYQAGSSDFAHLSLIRQRLLGAEEQLARALAEVYRAHLSLLRCTGQLISKETR